MGRFSGIYTCAYCEELIILDHGDKEQCIWCGCPELLPAVKENEDGKDKEEQGD